MSELHVALTFDAEHPSRAHCPPHVQDRIVETLESRRAVATFFLQGSWVGAYPQLARTIAESGHLVGNHSHAHARMTRLSDEGLRDDVREAEEHILVATGADPRPWFRCPYGDGADDRRVLDGLQRLGYRHVHWDVDSCDWCDGQTAESVLATIHAGIKAAGDSVIVLMHTWPAHTAAMLPRLIAELDDMRAKFVTVSEIVDNGD